MTAPDPLPIPVSSTASPTDFLGGRAWAWLLELGRRLHVGVQLVDLELTPLLTPGDAPAARALAAALASGAAPVRGAVASAMSARTPHSVVVETLQAHCLPLVVGRVVVGALVTAREVLGGTAEAGRTRGELELLGATLRSAVEAHLASVPAPATLQPAGSQSDLDLVSAFARLLSEASQGGRSEQQLVETLAEALAVWHDVELRGYAQRAEGDYELAVALPGAARTAVPDHLPADDLPPDDQLTPLTPADLDRLDLEALGPTLALRLASGAGGWLLFFSGRVDRHDVARFSVYAQLLKERLKGQSAEAASRLTAGMARRLLAVESRVDESASSALEMLEREIGAALATLHVSTASGAPVVKAGRPAPVQAVTGGHLVIVRRASDQPTVTLAVARQDGRTLTAQQRELVELAADLFESWGQTAAARVGERRASVHPLDEVLERFAEQACARGSHVSAVVMRAATAVFRPGMTQTWVAQARAIMRASDIVGMLSEGEIGFLLHDATGEQAVVAAARLRRLLVGEDPALASDLATGVASRSPGAETSTTGLVQEARQRATRGSVH